MRKMYKLTGRKRNAIRDRRERAEEKKRMEEAAARMSAKKLQRLRKVRWVSCSGSPS